MKKLLSILLTLLMVFALPLTAFAEDADTASTSDVSSVGGVDTSEVESTEETEPVSDEDAPKTTFGFFPSTLSQTLPIMGMGMLGIFLVTSVIILAVLILSKVGKKEED